MKRLIGMLALPVYGLLFVGAWLYGLIRPGNKDGLPKE